MVRQSHSPRWNGEDSHPFQASPTSRRDAVGTDDTEAAVHRLLATINSTMPTSTVTKTSRRYSGTSSSSPHLPRQKQFVTEPGPTRNSRRDVIQSVTIDCVVPQFERVDLHPQQDKINGTKSNSLSPSNRTATTKAYSFSQGDLTVSSTLTDPPSPPPRPAVVAPNLSMNEGRHGRRSIEGLSIDAMSPATSPQLSPHDIPPPPPPRQVRTTLISQSYRGSPPKQELLGESLVESPRNPSVSRRPVRRMYSTPGIDRRSDSISGIVSGSSSGGGSSSPGSGGSGSPASASSNETGLVLRDTNSNTPPNQRYVTKQQQESDEEREKQDAGSRSVGRTTRSSSRQMFGKPVRANRIRLHVYDLIAQETVMQLPWGCHFPIGQCFNAVNTGLHTLGTGAYHVGLEINGIEYAFGANDRVGATGIFTCMPKHSPGYQYRTTIDFGERTLVRKILGSRRGDDIQYAGTKERYVDGREVLREMASEYLGLDYDLLRRNCCTFAHDACLRLGVRDEEIPTWFRNLCVAGALTQDAANSTLEPLNRVFSACDAFEEYVRGSGFEVITDGPSCGDDDIQVVMTEDTEYEDNTRHSRSTSRKSYRKTASV